MYRLPKETEIMFENVLLEVVKRFPLLKKIMYVEENHSNVIENTYFLLYIEGSVKHDSSINLCSIRASSP